MSKKKLVDFCEGCPDNRDPLDSGDRVHCKCVEMEVGRFRHKIEPGDKNRDEYCPQRRKAAKNSP